MEVYGVFEGGGAKGAALAGCLEAARANGITFRAVGGTSAGAIVAYLSSVGFTGDEMKHAMTNGALRFPKLLEDGGERLQDMTAFWTHAARIANSDSHVLSKVLRLFHLGMKSMGHLRPVFRDFGIYRGDALRRALLELTRTKLKGIGDDVTFSELRHRGCTPLRVVATDVTGRCVARFDDTLESRSKSALTAVRCSAGYPLVFVPVQLQGARIVDGGLASNLPSFLFADESRNSRLPVLCFELVSARRPAGSKLLDFVTELAATALEASDTIMIDMVGTSGYRIPVQIPDAFSTLRVNLTSHELESLFNTGYVAANQRLSTWSRLLAAKQAGENVQRRLQAIYGRPKLIDPMLAALTLFVSALKGAQNLRASIMLATGRSPATRIVAYHFNFRAEDHDSSLELDYHAGCTGEALRRKAPVFADLEGAKTGYAEWGLTEDQQSSVAGDRKSMIAVPIFARSFDRAQSRTQLPVIGTLAIDSSTPLAETGWTRGEQMTEDIVRIMENWADILGRVLGG